MTFRLLILVLLAVAALSTGSLLKAAERLLGDLDKDGILTGMDIGKQLAFIHGRIELSEAERAYADVNRDGVFNDADTREIEKLILQTSQPGALPRASVLETSPVAGESGVALTREFVVRFTLPLALDAVVNTHNPNTNTNGHLWAEFAGRKLLTRAELSGDRRKATLFFLEPLPASARVRVSFDPTGLRDLLGRELDPDGNGVAGGSVRFDFDTLSITAVTRVGVVGTVYGVDVGVNSSTTKRPLAGVTITVDGAEQTLRATTGADGKFTLSPAPAGKFFVLVDGRTAAPGGNAAGGYYAFVGKQWEGIAGRLDTPVTPATEGNAAGDIYLPFIPTGTLQPVSQTTDTVVNFAPSVVAENPTLADVKVTVPANSLFSDNGARGGLVGIAPVAADKLPEPLPPGLNLPLVITIQTDGATNFDRPVPVRFPNLPDPKTGLKLAPGAKSALWSFNHDTGHWEIAGPMTVTADGNFVETDAGVGVRQPGWHGAGEGTVAEGGAPAVGGSDKPADCGVDFGEGFMKGFKDNWENLALCATAPAKRYPPVAVFRCAARGSKEIRTGGENMVKLAEAAKAAHEAGRNGDIGGALTAVSTALTGTFNFLSGCFKDFAGQNGADDLTNCADFGAGFAKDSLEAFAAELKAKGCPVNPELEQAIQAAKNLKNLIDAFKVGNAVRKFRNAREVEKQWKEAASAISALLDTIERLRTNPVPPQIIGTLAAGVNTESELATALSELVKATEALRDCQSAAADYVDFVVGFADYFEDVSAIYGKMLLVNGRPHSGVLYYVFQQEDSVVRGKYKDRVRLVAAPGAGYILWVLDSATLKVGQLVGVAGLNGVPTSLATIPLSIESEKALDSDQDGLSDLAEHIVGSDPLESDSDNDGIPDGAEVRNGTDPLDGKPAAVGIIAASDTPGDAVDVAAASGLAAVADSGAGVILFNVASAYNPVRIAQVDTPGTARAVAFGNSVLAVADGTAGLSVIDVIDPPKASILHQIGFGASATSVTTNGTLGYVGLGDGSVALVDLPSGAILQRKKLAPNAVVDLTIGREVLYVLCEGALYAVDLAGGELGDVVSVSAPGNTGARRSRLVPAGDRLYAAFMTGVNVFSTTNPLQPVLLRSNQTAQLGWKQIVPNGSGLGIAAVGLNNSDDGAHDISVYSLATDGSLAFQTTIEMPGLANAVAIYNGLAYVADGAAGLQIVNYLAYDNLKKAPTISLSASIALDGTTSAEEGKAIRLTATVTDDVQVRNVEFLVDGAVVAADGGFPFEHRLAAPLLSLSKTSFTVQARAFDTGGSKAETPVFTIPLVRDATPPRVTRVNPSDGAIAGALDTVFISFNEPLNPTTVTASSVLLRAAGSDGLLGTPDDVILAPYVLTWREATNSVALGFAAKLGPGHYRVEATTALADTAGNRLAAAYASRFFLFGGADRDRDGVPDDLEVLLGLDPDNSDSNGNKILDGAEDYDADGLTNAQEIVVGTDPAKLDTDGTGQRDSEKDSDGDGLTNLYEFGIGTNPARADSDGDGWNDEMELAVGTNPLDPASKPPYLAAARSGADVQRTATGNEITASNALLSFNFRTATPPLLITHMTASGSSTEFQMARPPVVISTQPAGAANLYMARPPVTITPQGQGGSTELNGLMATPPIKIRSQ